MVNLRSNAALRWLASSLPAPAVTVLRYPREFLHVRGRYPARSAQPSVAFFTVRKCASTFTKRLMADIARRHLNLTPLNLVAYYWDAVGQSDVYGHLNQHAEMFLPHGFFYAPIRRHVDLSHAPEIRRFGMLRDPRDVVVSAYFSARYSHRAPASAKSRGRFARRRQRAAAVDFESWIRGEAARTKTAYREFRLHLPRDRILTYEQMWTDFGTWLAQLGLLLNVSFDDADFARYERMLDKPLAKAENVQAHRRRGTPGEHREKLSNALIAELDHLFAEELRWLYD